MNEKHIMKLAAVLIGLLAFAGAAQAQVAAPRLNDIETNTLETFNAAVLPWHQTTIVGVNVLNKITGEIDVGGSTTEFATGKGNALYLRAVGPTFGFTAETSKLTIDTSALFSPPSGATEEIKNTVIGVASKLGDSFTVSLAMENEQQDDVSSSNSFKRSSPTLGGTWKISNAFYLGGTYAKGKVDISGGGATGSGDRTITRWGAGFYNRTDTSGFHVEVYQEDAGLVEVRDAADLLLYAEQGKTTGLTLEFVGGNFLFGLESVKESRDELRPFSVPALATQEEKSRTITLGYTPKMGFAITLAKLNVEQTNTGSPGATTTFDATVLGLAWKF